MGHDEVDETRFVVNERLNSIPLRPVLTSLGPVEEFPRVINAYAKLLWRYHNHFLQPHPDGDTGVRLAGELDLISDYAASTYLSIQPASRQPLRRLFSKLLAFEVPEGNAARFIVELEGYRKATNNVDQRPLIRRKPSELSAFHGAYAWIESRISPTPVRPDIPEGSLDDPFWRRRVIAIAREEDFGNAPTYPETLTWARQMAAEHAMPLTKAQSAEVSRIVLPSPVVERAHNLS